MTCQIYCFAPPLSSIIYIRRAVYTNFLHLSNMTRPKAKITNDLDPTGRWDRRANKRKPRMRVHGQGMKKLARRLQEGTNAKR